MTDEELKNVLEAHKRYVVGDEGGVRADLRDEDLSMADLRGKDLRDADLRDADLRVAYLKDADLRGADLRRTNLRGANLRGANLRGANLRGANLSGADLRGADLSGANGLTSAIDFMEENFERTADGYLAYKTFNTMYDVPKEWEIKKGSVIRENVQFDRCCDCGCGINVAPLEWVRKRCDADIWKVLIRWEWLPGVCVPYNSDGKIRCERVELLEVVE